MDRVYESGASGVAPTPPAVPSTGYPSRGNPGTGTMPTVPGPYMMHSLVEEIMAVISAASIAPDKAVLNQLKQALDTIYMSKNGTSALLQNFAGLTRSMTALGGGLVREYVDVTNAATVGGIEIGVVYNCAINTATGVWAGRDIADICWLEKWHDVAGTKEFWFSPTGAVGSSPAWVLAYSLDLINNQISSAAPMDHDNLFTNGSFDVWNSNNGQISFVNPAATYTADQVMSYSGTGGQSTVSRMAWNLGDVNNVNNNSYYLQAVQSVAATAPPWPITAYVEGVRSTAGKKVFIRVRGWCGAGTVVVTPNFEQSFGTGGAPSVQTNTPTIPATITLTTTPQEFLLQVTAPSIVGKTLGTNNNDYCRLDLVCPVTATFVTSWDSLKISLKNTPFVPAPAGIDAFRCKRYYEILGGSAANDLVGCSGYASAIGMALESYVPYSPKRSIPAIAKVGTWNVLGCGQPIVGGPGFQGCFLQALSTVAAKMNVATSNATTYLEVNSRL